jgi:exopolyphosphatase
MQHFLTKTRETAKNFGLPHVYVCGNEGGDMDSIVSALFMAYFSSLKNKDKLYIPVCNFAKKYLNLRKDVNFGLNLFNITGDDLFWIDEITPPENSEFILVDHNNLSQSLSKYSQNVIGIIDHHCDEYTFFPNLRHEYKKIEPCGSCASLIVSFFTKEFLNEQIFEREFLALAILIDTKNLSNDKTTETDRISLDFLVDSHERRKELTKELKHLKKNVSGLSMDEILHRDQKQFVIKNTKYDKVPTDLKYGISVHLETFEETFQNHSENFMESCNDFCCKYSLDILIITFSQKIGKQLILFVPFHKTPDEKIEILEIFGNLLLSLTQHNVQKISSSENSGFNLYFSDDVLSRKILTSNVTQYFF